VYAIIDGIERYVTPGMLSLLNKRFGDIWRCAVGAVDELYADEAFNFTCIDYEYVLAPLRMEALWVEEMLG